MKRILIFLFVLLSATATVLAQGRDSSSQQSIDDLRLQLIELGGQEEATKLQAQQLDEALKPENIERALAGFGSTRPEELREQRRKQLTAERAAVTAQLEQLALRRSRLEAAISAAEVEAYHHSARGIVENYLGVGLNSTSLRIAVVALVVVFVSLCALVFVLVRLRNQNRI
jgi:hypothetical protein